MIKWYWQIVIFLGFILMWIVIHEIGHYFMADYYGLNPRIAVFNIDEQKGLPFYQKWAMAVYHDNSSDEISNKIIYNALYFEIILAFLILSIAIPKVRHNNDLSLILIGFVWAMMITWILGWCPFYQLPNSDAFQLFNP